MKITKIEAQKKSNNRYNIYIDDAFAFGVDEATFIKFALYNGMELTSQEIDAIQEDDHYQQAYQKALTFLNFKMRTMKEVADKLAKQGYDGETIDRVLQKLVELNFVNDHYYAEMYLNENRSLAMKGPNAIAFELKKKGINDRIVQEVISQYDEEEQYNQALTVAEAYVKRQTRVSVKTARQKVYAYLLQRGYESDIVQDVVTHLEFNVQEEQEVELAVKEALMVFKRLTGKKPEEQVWYQVKTKLYQKGFASGTIEEAMEVARMEAEEWT